jgi:hypothetical protein
MFTLLLSTSPSQSFLVLTSLYSDSQKWCHHYAVFEDGFPEKGMGMTPNRHPQLQPGLSGFSIHEDLGFVAIFTDSDGTRSTYAAISPLDKYQVQSSEAFCLIQLAGGMDLGTSIFPPHYLEQFVAEELESEISSVFETIRPLSIRAIPNRYALTQVSVKYNTTILPNQVEESSSEQNEKLENTVTQFLISTKNLPGISHCTRDEVLRAIKLHTNGDRELDRIAFLAVLDTLRRNSCPKESSRVAFEITVDIYGPQDHPIVIEVTSAFHAIAIALRYNREIKVSRDIFFELNPKDVYSRFPKFRNLEEFKEDARIMKQQIPNMYAKFKYK